MRQKKLREGFTTGSAAAAAAKAAALFLGGCRTIDRVEIPLPVGGRLSIPVCSAGFQGKAVRATVIKDAGDDPDVTHHAVIGATVSLIEQGSRESILIEGGKGVGRVTRPGLSVPPGQAAINPVPRRQIEEAVKEGMAESGLNGAIRIVLDVEDGEEIARKTLNPRLGILGGISILGTRGTVKPFSNESYRETIRLSMDVAVKAGVQTIGLSTGGKSEGFLRRLRPDLPEISFIQVADFFSFSLAEGSRRGFAEILYACFFGKLIKMAQGHEYTHAKSSRIDFSLLSEWCARLGVRNAGLSRIRRANTAREALGFIKAQAHGKEILGEIAGRALQNARAFAGPGPALVFHVFDADGRLLLERAAGAGPKDTRDR